MREMSKTGMREKQNCELALRLWRERVRPQDVAHSLSQWKCGTQACFGGHLATWPEFQALGIRPGTRRDEYASPGEPVMPEKDVWNGWDVSERLFGVDLFCMRRDHGDEDYAEMPDDPGATDHQVVVDRLTRRIKQLR